MKILNSGKNYLSFGACQQFAIIKYLSEYIQNITTQNYPQIILPKK